jgi:predicted Zn-dependent protease
MTETKGIYHFGEEQQEADISLLKDKLSITLRDGRRIFWYYREIIKEHVYDFRYTKYPPQLLRVSSSQFADELHSRIEKGKKSLNAGKIAPLAKVLLVFIVFILLAYFLLVPWIASALASRFPVSYEKTIGDQAFNAMKTGFVVDEKKTAYINDFFGYMDIPSRYNVQITVVKGDVVNAFALPGGHIVVYDKIIDGLQSYPELAALLAHEFTHVENRHTVRTMLRQFSSKVFLSLLMGDATAVGGVILNNADELKSLSYSRSLEKEADENGARLLAERKIDCAGFVRLFHLLKKESGTVQPTEWLSSHPDLNKRIETIQDNVFCKNSTPSTSATLQELFKKLQGKDW